MIKFNSNFLQPKVIDYSHGGGETRENETEEDAVSTIVQLLAQKLAEETDTAEQQTAEQQFLELQRRISEVTAETGVEISEHLLQKMLHEKYDCVEAEQVSF